MRKSIYRFIITVILALVSVSSFAFVWLKYVSEHNNTGHLLGYGNIVMALSIYFFLFVLSGRWFHAFKIGVERKAKLIAGVVFSIWATNAIEVFISIAITGNFRFVWDFIWRYLLLSAGQSVVLPVLVLVSVNIFWLIYPPTMVLEITGSRKNNLPEKLNGLDKKSPVDS